MRNLPLAGSKTSTSLLPPATRSRPEAGNHANDASAVLADPSGESPPPAWNARNGSRKHKTMGKGAIRRARDSNGRAAYFSKSNTSVAHFVEYVGRYIDRKSTRLNSSHLGISYAV